MDVSGLRLATVLAARAKVDLPDLPPRIRAESPTTPVAKRPA